MPVEVGAQLHAQQSGAETSLGVKFRRDDPRLTDWHWPCPHRAGPVRAEERGGPRSSGSDNPVTIGQPQALGLLSRLSCAQTRLPLPHSRASSLNVEE